MDPEVSVLLHCAAWRGLRESQVHVELCDRFNRQTDEALERHIEEVWTQRVSREPWLFNGAKFRLHSFGLAQPEPLPPLPVFSSPKDPPSSTLPVQSPSTDCAQCAGDNSPRPDGGQRRDESLSNSTTQNFKKAHGPVGVFQRRYNADGTVQPSLISNDKKENAPLKPHPTSDCDASEGVKKTSTSSCPHRNMDRRNAAGSVLLTLRLGLTCYKDFLGTNWSHQAGGLRSRGEAEFGDPLALLAQPLGVGGVLCTRDGQVVLIRRSQRVAEAGGLLDIPGGHPEPKAVCEDLDHSVSEAQINIAMLQQRQGAVVSELFSSVCAEIRDEVNVPLSSLGQPVLMGIALNHTSAGRPSAEFYISCSLTSDEVKELYWRGGLEAHESTDIVFLSRMDILRLDRERPLWSELCPSAKGAVLLYQLVMPDEEQDSCSPSQTPITLSN